VDARNDFHGKEQYVLKKEKGNKKSAVERESGKQCSGIGLPMVEG
jgi:hypothetical protein